VKVRGLPVAVIGLGLMGGAIARNLAAAGWRVTGIDPDPAAAERARANGVRTVDSVAGLPRDVCLILTSLPGPDSLRATVQALAARPELDCVLAELSTLAIADKVAARDLLAPTRIAVLDCPISGTGAQAVDADLSIYASGERAAWDRVADIFPTFARRPRYVGDFGAGTRLKYIANLLVAIHNVASAEAMGLAEVAGIDAVTAVEVLREGAGNSRIFELRAPMMASRCYEPATMKLEVWAKDMQLIGAFARERGARTPLFDATVPVYEAVRYERPQQDTAAVFEALRKT
jgi:3-hydroxyisobutyrate dehydrogenase-like beta-hydroxyacid dehydrogenase